MRSSFESRLRSPAKLMDNGGFQLRDDVHVGRGIRRGHRQAAEGVLVS